MEEREDDINESISVVPGDATVRMSSESEAALPSSGKPKIADRRLRMNVLSVGRRRE
jgi:hypothetical protein